MSIFGVSPGHFMASITMKPTGLESGRRNTPPYNGIRFGFVYADDREEFGLRAEVSDVWPEFLDGEGKSLAKGIPCVGTLNAVMHIVSSNMVPVHYERLSVGTKFFCVEGSMIVADGVVMNLSVDTAPATPLP